MKIEIIPVGDVNLGILNVVKDELNEKFKSKFIIGETLKIPDNALDMYRDQYDAKIIMKTLESKRKGNEKLIGITSNDIYIEGMNFVFGITKNNVALVSTARLNPEFYTGVKNFDLLVKRVIKEVIHELGHMFGLSHCENPRCVMSFSNSVAYVDEKKDEFCERCVMKMSMEGIEI